MSYVVIEAANLWATFARAHYVSTALRARLAPSQRVVLGTVGPIRTVHDAVTLAVRSVDPTKVPGNRPWAPRDEPDWQNPSVWQTLIESLGASNAPAVQRAAAYRPMTLRLLPQMRNYFAHKSERAGRNARQLPRAYGQPQDMHPMMFLLQPAPGFRQPVALQWLDDLALTLRLSDPTFLP